MVQGVITHSVSVRKASNVATDFLRQPVYAGWRLFIQRFSLPETGSDFDRQGT